MKQFLLNSIIICSVFFSYSVYSAEIYRVWQESVIERATKKAERVPTTISIALGIPGGALTDVFPIYHPKVHHPIWMMAIVENENKFYTYMPYSFAYLYYKKSNLNVFYRPLLHPQVYYYVFKEPFMSDKVVQFYVYRGRLLLVGRDWKWEVSHWKTMFSEELSEKQVKSFLKDKWFQP